MVSSRLTKRFFRVPVSCHRHEEALDVPHTIESSKTKAFVIYGFPNTVGVKDLLLSADSKSRLCAEEGMKAEQHSSSSICFELSAGLAKQISVL